MNSSAPRDDWIVHGPEIVGGNLGSSIDTDNSRMSAGWKESSTPIAGIQESTIREWKSPSHDRPFMWNMDYGSKYVISAFPENISVIVVFISYYLMHHLL